MKMRRFVWLALLALVPMVMLGCDETLTKKNSLIVVSDGITWSGEVKDGDEVLPNAIVYRAKKGEETSLTRLLTAEKVEGVAVYFGLISDGGAWIPLNEKNDPFITDEEGKVTLKGLHGYLEEYLHTAPVTLRLGARASHSAKTYKPGDDSTYIEDDLGIIKILSNTGTNPDVIFADHDNTIHATGGLNSIGDWINFINVMKGNWPYVDDNRVKAHLDAHLDAGKDLILITGMSPEVRYFCRQQMMAHFEEPGEARHIPIVVKKDMPYEHSNKFKAETLSRLKAFYGEDQCLAMVGDTVRQDGYGARMAGIPYVPINVYYDPSFWLLNTEGRGWIHPDSIAWNWDEVMAFIEEPFEEDPNYFMKFDTGFINTAHRGGCELMPENVMAAYENSLAVGAHTLEGDVHMTSDGHIVVSHDATVDRCTNETGAIKEMTLAEVQALDAGYRFTMDGGKTYPQRGKGHIIPLLSDVFDLMKSYDASKTIPMVLEIKQEGEEIVDKVLTLIKDEGFEDYIILGGFNTDTLAYIKVKSAEMGMTIKTIFDTKAVLEFALTPTFIMKKEDYTQPADVLCLPAAMMTQALMAKIRILGMKCYIWTVNSETEMKRQMNWFKVDGIMTDNPAKLDAVIKAE